MVEYFVSLKFLVELYYKPMTTPTIEQQRKEFDKIYEKYSHLCNGGITGKCAICVTYSNKNKSFLAYSMLLAREEALRSVMEKAEEIRQPDIERSDLVTESVYTRIMGFNSAVSILSSFCEEEIAKKR